MEYELIAIVGTKDYSDVIRVSYVKDEWTIENLPKPGSTEQYQWDYQTFLARREFDDMHTQVTASYENYIRAYSVDTQRGAAVDLINGLKHKTLVKEMPRGMLRTVDRAR